MNPDYNEIKEKLAPCGLSCEKCFAYSKGKIKFHSGELKKLLGNFGIFAQRFTELLKEPAFEQYPSFNNMLEYFNKVSCEGCRKEKCRLFADCKVRDCHRNKKVDFCFQCDEFPCEKTGFDENLYKRYVVISNKMKETGVIEFYNQTKENARY